VSTIALIGKFTIDSKKLEVIFVTVFSVLIFAIFYVLISMNGVVLGNDPAVHLEKAQIFLSTGQISLANLGWIPPLYQIVLAMIIAFTGATDIGQLIFLVKVLAVIVDWLLVFSVYLFASKYFSKRVGIIAVVLLLMAFPIYEANAFGGYTTVLALAFMLLVFIYTPLAVERVGYVVVAFFSAFALVLSHQLAAFLAVFIMPPVLLFMLIKSKGAHLKVVAALIFGGGVAFFLYYFKAMVGYLDVVIYYVFLGIKEYAYQIPAVTFNAFMINFGFILFFGLAGTAIAFLTLKKQKKPLFNLILMLSFFVPLFFAESYLVGLYLPFGWFIYYLTTPLVILAAVFVVFLADKVSLFYVKHRTAFRKNWVKVVTVALLVLLSVMVIYRSNVVYGRIMESSVYYSRTDTKALDAGVWLKANYPENTTVVVTEIPGFWFQEFCGKNVTAETDPAVQRNEIAESVLSLSYELQQPQTLLRAYEAKGYTADENWVSIDNVWYRASFSSDDGNFLSFVQGGENHTFTLSQLSKQVSFEDQSDPKKIVFTYSNDYVILTKTLTVQNDSYSISVQWALAPLNSSISNVSLYLTTLFDLRYHFDEAQIPGLMDWVNPWDMPDADKRGNGEWTVAGFTSADLKDNYTGLYDSTNDVAFAYKFSDVPDWGNIGALGNRQIDAVRFEYQLGNLSANQTVTRSYQTLCLSQNSYSPLQRDGVQGLFDLKVLPFTVVSRDFSDCIKKNNIGFIVYDKNQLDPQLIKSKLLQLVYSNDRYTIFKITG